MNAPQTNPKLAGPERDVTSGVALALGALVSVVMMSMHPSVLAHGTEAMFAEAVRLALATRFVHGVLIVATLVMVFGFGGFAARLGLGRAWVRLGLVAYGFGGLAMCGAAILNGLVFPAMSERYAERGVEDMQAASAVLAWNWELNQALALAGVLAWSVAVLAWSSVLVRLAGAWRWIGALGLLIGATNAAVFASGKLDLDVHGFGLFVLAQSAWSFAVGVRLALPLEKSTPAPA